jgi:large subunit ribosomal protein L35
MPKLKTHKATAKRFKLTKNGKVMHMLAGRTHLRRRKKANKNSDFRHAVPSSVKYIIKQVKQTAGKAASS